jgi:formylglycine-generating enzyme required for sulfatase activity
VRTALQLASLVVAAGSLLALGGKPEHAEAVELDEAAEAPRPAGHDPVAAARTAEASDESATDENDENDESDADESEGDDGSTADEPNDESPMAEGPDGGKRKLPHGGCPSTMVRAGNYCIDRYEAPNRRGAHPLVMQSANDANAWCTDHHKRMCTEDEWISACQGEEHRTYPYGNEHVDGRCNDDKAWQKVDEALLARWPSVEAKAHAKELYQGTRSGSKRKCSSEAGARDMTGNVEEWVVRTREHANDYPYLLIGCYWSGCYGGNKPTCHSTNNAHGPEFRFYETGFRCCKDLAGKR